MHELRIHDDFESRQYQVRIHFREGEDRSVVANFFPYGTDKAASLAEARLSAQEASKRLNIPWIE